MVVAENRGTQMLELQLGITTHSQTRRTTYFSCMNWAKPFLANPTALLQQRCVSIGVRTFTGNTDVFCPIVRHGSVALGQVDSMALHCCLEACTRARVDTVALTLETVQGCLYGRALPWVPSLE